MNNLFFLLFCISFLCIPIFILWAIINLIRRKPSKRRFAFAGISALTLIISTIGFGLTMDDDTSPTEAVSESVVISSESPTLYPTVMPTARPTETPTLRPTESPTPLPASAPTLQPTATPTQEPTIEPTPQSEIVPTPQPIETPQPTVIPTVTPTEVPQPATPLTEVSDQPSEKASESQVSTPVGDMVWLSATGEKYHSIDHCGRMNPDKARQVSLEEALSMGYEKCSKCY